MKKPVVAERRQRHFGRPQTVVILTSAVVLSCGAAAVDEADAGAWSWELPPGTPAPVVPADNPMNVAKVALGRRLFFDKELSRNRQQSCGTCHEPAKGFTDARPQAIGSTQQLHRRNSPGLANVAYASALTWANPLVTTLERQALLPLLGETPVELGWAGAEAELLARLAGDGDYVRKFREAFPQKSGEISLATVTMALATFQRTLLSFHSPYDRWAAGETHAMNESAKRGLALYNSERLECYHCHSGFTFSDSVVHAGAAQSQVEKIFHNTGLYNVDGLGSYPAVDTGTHEVTGRVGDMGRFRTPTLRNIAVTAPYMHDGSIATLGEVIDHYARGGRGTTPSSANNPYRSDLVRGFDLTPQERLDLIAFLEALTDEEFLRDPRHRSPSDPP